MQWLCLRLPQLAVPRQAGPGTLSELERLAAWAYQWSSRICCREAGGPAAGQDTAAALWIELAASAALFDQPVALMRRIAVRLDDELGYRAETGLAPSLEGAALLARAAADPAGRQALPSVLRALDVPALRATLAPLPLHLLDLPGTTIAALIDTGLRRIGELLCLPAAAIARRFGPGTSLYLRRLIAQALDPRTSWRLPPFYRTRCEFDFEVHDTTALRFPLQRLLEQFQGYLRAMDRSVQQFTLRLEHRDRASTALTIGLSTPGRDAARFSLLLRERLEATALPAAVRALELEALELTAATVAQPDFFGTEAQQAQHLQQVLDRLHARLGSGSVQSLVQHADYRPECAWRLVAAQPPRGSRPGRAAPATPERPVWLLPTPRRIEAPPAPLGDPERIESGWWDGADCARDYYRTRSACGQGLWVFHDLRTGHWYLHGLWA